MHLALSIEIVAQSPQRRLGQQQEVGHDFHLEALRQDPAVTALVATRAGDLLGIEVTIDFRSTNQPAADEEEPELDKDSLFDAPESSTDPVDLLKSTFGATVVEEED